MSYECDCGWTSGESDGDSMPMYNFAQQNETRVQVAHCPECMDILDERENNAPGI